MNDEPIRCWCKLYEEHGLAGLVAARAVHVLEQVSCI
jgi:hypothetical protein